MVMAKNVGGEARNTCHVTVEGSRQPGRDVQTRAPQFVEPLKNKEVVEGSRTKLDCVCIALPDPEVMSKFNNVFLYKCCLCSS